MRIPELQEGEEGEEEEEAIIDTTPVTFIAPSFQPDVLLNVFGKEFRVHSVTLKLNSAFFRKFLDPRNTTSSLFSYEYFTKVEKDNTWVLSSNAEVREMDTSGFKGDTTKQQTAFQNLLCAIYRRPYQIMELAQLRTVTELADYYCALPVLSSSLLGTLYLSPKFTSYISADPCSVLILANKLRNKMLFNDSLIHALGPWKNPQYLSLPDSPLKTLATAIHHKMCAKLVDIQHEMVNMSSKYISHSFQKKSFADEMIDVVKRCRHGKKLDLLPCYYRKCYETHFSSDTARSKIRSLLKPLLENNLLLDRNGSHAGLGSFADYFCCFEIEDSDIPWDQNEVDW